jgi:hypothetical protein
VDGARVEGRFDSSLLLPCCALKVQEAQQGRQQEVQEGETFISGGKRQG